jgi:hypothetical protein
MNKQQFEFKVWDIPNKMFLKEFQTEYGQWVWGRREDLVGQSTFKWILDHPDDFVVCIHVGVSDSNKNKIFTGDIVECWSEAGMGVAVSGATGVIEFVGNCFVLKTGKGIHLENWPNAEQIMIKGNIYEYPQLYKD